MNFTQRTDGCSYGWIGKGLTNRLQRPSTLRVPVKQFVIDEARAEKRRNPAENLEVCNISPYLDDPKCIQKCNVQARSASLDGWPATSLVTNDGRRTRALRSNNALTLAAGRRSLLPFVPLAPPPSPVVP